MRPSSKSDCSSILVGVYIQGPGYPHGPGSGFAGEHLGQCGADVCRCHPLLLDSAAGRQDGHESGIDEDDVLQDGRTASVFKGKCAELCGASHALMDFKVVVEDRMKNSKAWVTKMKSRLRTTAAATEAGEAKYSQLNALAAMRSRPIMSSLDRTWWVCRRETVAGFRENNEEWLRRMDPVIRRKSNRARRCLPGAPVRSGSGRFDRVLAKAQVTKLQRERRLTIVAHAHTVSVTAVDYGLADDRSTIRKSASCICLAADFSSSSAGSKRC